MLELAGYRTETLLYEGNRSRIYQAHRQIDNTPVILKTHRKIPAKLPELNRIRREFEVCSMVRHEGLRHCENLVFYDGGLALVFEDVGGISMQNELDRIEATPGRVLSTTIQLARALQAIHEQNLVHCAIHPSNILMIPEDYTFALIDFSHSTRMGDAISNRFPDEQPQPHLQYLSPEQAGSIYAPIDVQSDLFSLGVLMYRLMTGHLPFRAESLAELRERHVGMPPVPPSEMSPDCPQALSDLVTRLLERDPHNRYVSAAALEADLERCLERWEHSGEIDSSALMDYQRGRMTPYVFDSTGETTEIGKESSPVPIDLEDFARAALAISSEISLQNILRKILEITAEMIGGDRSLLLLQVKDTIHVEATSSDKGERIETLLGIPLEDEKNIAHGVIRHVLDCGDAILIEDTSRSRFHALDPYLRHGGKRSILCAPIQSKNAVFGVFFMETKPEATPFSHDDLRILRLLQPYFGISLENARLYQEMVELNIKLNREIEEHQEIEVALRKNQEKLELATIGADLGLWDWNLDTDVILANKRYFSMLGYEPYEFSPCATHWVTIVHPDDLEAAAKSYTEILQGKTSVIEIEYRLKTRNGDYRWIRDYGKIIEYDSQGLPRRLSGIHQDITERKFANLREREVEANMLQQQKLEAIGTLAGGVAHEINNPINIIMNFGQLIMDEIDPESTSYDDARHIVEESQRVAKIVKNLLAFSRQDQEGCESASVRTIVESTLSLTSKILRQDHIRVEHSIPKDLPEVFCHQQQIMQVMMNLVTNARDALNDRFRGFHEDKAIYIEANLFRMKGKKFVRVIVEDHGTGIPVVHRERIFDPFYTSKPHDKGTGLGLSISHRIIKDHGGELSFKTEEGRFTRFFFDLPVDLVDLPNSENAGT